MSYVSFGSDAVAEAKANLALLKPGGPPMPTPADTFNQILASSPIAADVSAAWAPINDAVKGASALPPNFYEEIQKDPKAAANAAVSGLAQTLPDVLGNIGIDPGSYGDQMLTAAAGNLGTLAKGDAAPLLHAAIATSASYACQSIGIPPQLGTLAVDTVWNGQITSGTLEAAGAVAGSIAGAALGSYVGIPPVIGAFVGSILGKSVGDVVADVFGIGGKEARDAMRSEWASVASSIEGQMNGVRDQYINLLIAHRGEYWATFDRIIDNISYQWQSFECNFAHSRFPLLWSGNSNVNPFFLYKYTPSLCGQPINQNLSRGTGCLNTNGILPNITGGGCGAIYGCPYPQFPDMGTNDPYRERVVQAFAAYDIWWVPPEQRQAIDQQWVQYFAQPGDVSPDLKWNTHVMNVYAAQKAQAYEIYHTSAPVSAEGTAFARRVDSMTAGMKQMLPQGFDKTGKTDAQIWDACPPSVPRGISWRQKDWNSQRQAWTTKDVPLGCALIPYDDWMTYWASYRLHCSALAPNNPKKCEAMCDAEAKSTLTVFQAQLMTTMEAALDLRSIQAAAVRIAGDLVSSGAVYAGAAKVNADRSNLIQGNLTKAFAQNASDQALVLKKNAEMVNAVRYGRTKNTLINGAMLMAGGGLLAAAIMRRR